MFQSQSPIPYKPLEETPFTWVSTPAQLAELIDKLRRAREFAVDLEYHSYRTYGGFVCLMQISTREEDWIVDPFELRDELQDLNEVFTNPNITKVGLVLVLLHIWLTCTRSYMEPTVMLFGSSKISICIW